MFKVEIRKDCKECHNPITAPRFRTYCGPGCRNKAMNKKFASAHAEWHRAKRDREALTPSKNKVQCLICNKWYIQVYTHILQVHGMNAREYKEAYDLEVKRGIVPGWYRELKGDQALENKTYLNLQAGSPHRFKPGDPRAGKYHRSPITLARVSALGRNSRNKKPRSRKL